jgi:hypothetical protein
MDGTRDMYKANPGMSSNDAMFRPGGSIRERKIARDELDTFVLATYHGLREAIDEQPLDFLCRMDVSVMMNPTSGLFEYFVNEVEQSPSVSFFGFLEGSCFVPHQVGDETREVLVKWLDRTLA